MHLYIGSNGRVAAIDLKSGRTLWEYNLPASGQVVTVLEHDGRVFAGCNGNLFALDGATGELLWRNGLEGFGYHPVSLSVPGKSAQYVPTVVPS
jgi:outer membrane protein assembly factor BamB